MPEWLLQVVAMVAGASGVYAAIRADLAYIRAKAEGAADAAAGANRRIDEIFNQRSRT